MAVIIFRLALLTAGMAAVEIGLGGALVEGSLAGLVLVLVVGLPLTIAGSAGFIAPLLGGPKQKGASTDA